MRLGRTPGQPLPNGTAHRGFARAEHNEPEHNEPLRGICSLQPHCCRVALPTHTPGIPKTAAMTRIAVRSPAANWCKRGTASCGAVSSFLTKRKSNLHKTNSATSAPKRSKALYCRICRSAYLLHRRRDV